MKLKLLLIATLAFCYATIAQNLTEENLMGEWQAIKVTFPKTEGMPPTDVLKMVEDAFMGSKFHFNGDKVFRITFGELANESMKELLFLDNNNWKIHNGQIRIGTLDNDFSLMHIGYREQDGKNYFMLPTMQLEMKKLSSDELSEPNVIKPEPVKVQKVETVEDLNAQVAEVEVEVNDAVPFPVVDNPPLAPDCKSNWNLEKRKKCTQDFISNHLMRKFNTDLASEVGVSGKIRITIEFIIDTNGNVVNVTAKGGPDIMNENAIEVISSLPVLRPGTHKGQLVNVSYREPLLFQIVD